MIKFIFKRYNSKKLLKFSKSGNYDKVNMILKIGNVDINHIDDYGRSAIFYAVIFNIRNLVRLLISYGANVNVVDKSGRNPVSYAAESGYNTLLNTIFNKYDSSSSTTENELQIKRIVKFRLINQLDNSGYSSMHYACINNNRTTYELLLENGGDSTTINFNKEKPKDLLN